MTNQRLSKEDEFEIYKDSLRDMTQIEIAKKYHISQPHVSAIIKKITKRNNRQLAVDCALDYIDIFLKEKHYIKMKRGELETLLQKTEDEKLKEKIIMSQVTLSNLLIDKIAQGAFMQSLQHDTDALAFYRQQQTLEEKPPELEPKDDGGQHYQ